MVKAGSMVRYCDIPTAQSFVCLRARLPASQPHASVNAVHSLVCQVGCLQAAVGGTVGMAWKPVCCVISSVWFLMACTTRNLDAKVGGFLARAAAANFAQTLAYY